MKTTKNFQKITVSVINILITVALSGGAFWYFAKAAKIALPHVFNF